MEMSNKPPIGCFNGSECIYDPKVCQLYEYRTEVCLFEHFKNWMKETTPQKYQAGKPVPTVEIEAPPPARVVTPTTPPPAPPRSAPKVGAIVGKVVSNPLSKEVPTKTGPKGICVFMVDDGATQVRVTLWERPDLAQLINMGDEVTLEGLAEGTVYEGTRQFNGGNRTTLVGANVGGIAVPQEKVFVIKNPNAPATEAQINQLNKMGIKNIAQNITKQQASDLISSRMKK